MAGDMKITFETSAVFYEKRELLQREEVFERCGLEIPLEEED